MYLKDEDQAPDNESALGHGVIRSPLVHRINEAPTFMISAPSTADAGMKIARSCLYSTSKPLHSSSKKEMMLLQSVRADLRADGMFKRRRGNRRAVQEVTLIDVARVASDKVIFIQEIESESDGAEYVARGVRAED